MPLHITVVDSVSPYFHPVQDCPQKSIQLSALYRTHTTGGSLKYCWESLLFFFNGFFY